MDINKSGLLMTFLCVLFFTSTVFAHVPSSQRSIEAIKRVRPKIESELKTKQVRYGAAIFIRIFKASKELEVWIKRQKTFEHLKTYPICAFGSEQLGPKVKEGDWQAPEGFYRVTPTSMNPFSNYHLSFNLGYPNEYDKMHKRSGSWVMVHGECVSRGCFAMTSAAMEEIYALADAALRNGQPFIKVHVFPFRMNEENMSEHGKSAWIEFWKNLKEGYDYFEKKRIPPTVKVKTNKYVIGP